MSKVVTVALAGIGGYGDTYLEGLLTASAEHGVRLVGAIDPQPERSRHLAEIRNQSIPLFADLESFYSKSSADLIVIAAPIHLHCPLTCLALSHGSNVLCEKPLCATIQEAIQMTEASQQSRRFVAIGYQWSFSPSIQALKRDIMTGDFGRPLLLKTLVLWPRKKSYYNRSRWAGALQSSDGEWVLDSPVNNATAHYFHNMVYVLGSARETSALPMDIQAELYRANPIENYDTAALRCHTENGVEILFFSTHAVSSSRGPTFHYEFEKAVVQYDLDNPQYIVARFHNGQTREYGDPSAEVLNKLWQSVESVRTGALLPCDVRTATAHTLCVNGAQDSMPDITAFPPEWVRTDRDDTTQDSQTWVKGLYEFFTECYDKAVLPSERGTIPWTRKGKTVDLRHYRFFPGGKPP